LGHLATERPFLYKNKFDYKRKFKKNNPAGWFMFGNIAIYNKIYKKLQIIKIWLKLRIKKIFLLIIKDNF